MVVSVDRWTQRQVNVDLVVGSCSLVREWGLDFVRAGGEAQQVLNPTNEAMSAQADPAGALDMTTHKNERT